MTKAESQARAYAMENLEGYHPMVRDFILGKGIFSHGEDVKMHMRVATKIAEHAAATFREQFAKEFSGHKANAVVEVPIPQKKNPMPHAWSSDPDRDAKVRMEEDGRTKPYRTLTELLRDEGAVVSKSDPLMAAREQLEVASNAQLAAARERDRADEARARYRKRWQERGRTIAKLQARLNERKASGVNSTLAGWCRVVQSQRTEAVSHAAACRKEVSGLRKLVSNYEDRISELNLKVNRLESDLDLAVQSHANATERRLKAEARVAELEAQVATLLEAEAWGVNCKPFTDGPKRSPSLSESGDGQSGLRTERVTLEITHSVPVAQWDWTQILETYRPGESVRVVEEVAPAVHRGSGVFDANGDEVPWEGVVAMLTDERDAAIRERDAWKQRHARECAKCSALADKVIALRARVAELEGAPAASGAVVAEKISRAGQFAPSEAPQPPKCTERESVTDRRPPEPRGAGNVTGFTEPAKCSAAVSKTGEGQSGLRTERVTLEVTMPTSHQQLHPETWPWKSMLGQWGFGYSPGEFVRVVDEQCPYAWAQTFARLESERDEAIRDLRSVTAERAKLEEQLESVASRAATAENRVAELESAAKLAPAANSGAGSNHAAPAASGAAGTGWLTAEEREALTWWCGSAQPVDIDQLNAWCAAIRNLLARSSPPEVVPPGQWKDASGPGHPQVSWQPFLDTVTGRRDAEWFAALAAAGVAVKEVGK